MQQQNEEFILSNFWKAKRCTSIQTSAGVARVYEFVEPPLRCLFIGTQFASCVELDTGKPGFAYLKEMVTALTGLKKKSNVLVLGHGGGALAKAALDQGHTVVSVDSVKELFDLSYQYFLVPKSARFTAVVDDARHYLESTQERFDLIFVDVFVNAEDVPGEFKTREWLSTIQTHLTPDGKVCMNYIGHEDQKDDFLSLRGSFLAVFGNLNLSFLENEDKLHQNILFNATFTKK